MSTQNIAQLHRSAQEKAGSTPARWQRSGETRGGSIPRNGTGSQRPAWSRRYGTPFPPLRDLPALFACYAVVACGVWAVLHPYEYRALVLSVLGVHA